MKKAYSYVRFSTPDQAKGDSYRRQTELAARYAASHGLELDERLTIRDLGVSAFRGANAETGGLGAFLKAIEAGDVEPGSVLLVEALDRISRQTARKALRVLEAIVDAGVKVVTLSDGKEYTREGLDGSGGLDLMMALLLLIRGNEESQTKSRRLRAAWVGKRRQLDKRALTSITVGWIKVASDGSRELIPERAKIVKRIFEQFIAGKGRQSIAAELNVSGVPTFGRTGQPKRRAKFWHASYVQKILRNPATYGLLVPHTTEHDEKAQLTRRVPLDPVPGYYPAVIDKETFERAQGLLGRGAPRGRHVHAKVQNVLSNLARCPKCSGSMTRVMKGRKGGPPYLVCSKAKAGAGCEYHAVKLPSVEAALRANARDLPRQCPHPDASLEADLDSVREELHSVSVKIDNLIDELSIRPSAAIRQQLAKLEERADALRKEREALGSKAIQTDSNLVKRRVDRLKAALASKKLDVQEVNASLRECMERVTVDYAKGALRFAWRHGGETALPFAGDLLAEAMKEAKRADRRKARPRKAA